MILRFVLPCPPGGGFCGNGFLIYFIQPVTSFPVDSTKMIAARSDSRRLSR